MEVVQIFCGAITTALVVWSASSWWKWDVEALRFQRSLSMVIGLALAWALAYQLGAYKGAVATQLDLANQTHDWRTAIDNIRSKFDTLGLHYDQTTDLAIPEVKYDSFGGVLIPGWALFYLAASASILMVFSVAPRRKSATHTGEPGASDEDRKGPET